MEPSISALRPVAELAAGRPHGDRLRYLAGCRCADCRRSNTEYERGRAAARKAGEWNGIVPAERTRAHIASLALAGVGRRQVADASGVAESIVVGIARGDRKNVRAATERAILGVNGQAIADRALIDAGPTWQLLDELVATGYSKAHLARELGHSSPAIQIRRTQCTVRTAYDVQRLHQRLRRVPAQATQQLSEELREEGYRPDRVERLVGEMAARQGMAPPDLQVHGEWISASAANLVAQLHAELTGEPA